MPYHTDSKMSMRKMNTAKMQKKPMDKKMTLKDAMDKFDKMKNKPEPMNKPSSTLNKLQKEFMKSHKQSKLHNDMMTKLMKMGYCIEQAHKISHKIVG
jgi:predicted transcriptional regulator